MTDASASASEKTANQNEIFDFVKTNLTTAGTDKYDEMSVIQKI